MRKWKSSLQCCKTVLGADCRTDHELFVAKIRTKLNRKKKATSILRFDTKAVPRGYDVFLSNKFSELQPSDDPETVLDLD